jgi:hypothetical protein
MLVFQTPGVPPNRGNRSFAAMGWTVKTRLALANTVTPNKAGDTELCAARGASSWVMDAIRLERTWNPMLWSGRTGA